MAVQRASLVNLVVDELIKLIRDRRLRADDPLPSAAELSEELDVSRTVVREAIAELAGQGLLTRRQGRETLVALPDSPQLERLLRLRFAVRGENFADLQEFRRILEVGAARLAAERATEQDIEQLRQALSHLQQATEGEDLHLKDQAFHREIARISGNDMVLLTLDGITPLLVELRRHAWAGWISSGRGLHDILHAHELIFDRIHDNDPEGAAESMRAHLLQTSSGLEFESGMTHPASRQAQHNDERRAAAATDRVADSRI